MYNAGANSNGPKPAIDTHGHYRLHPNTAHSTHTPSIAHTPTFTLHHTHGAARRGTLHTAHGDVPTPIFMPVGTYGTVKGMTPQALNDVGAHIVLGNTFHLWMRPGLDVMAQFGGLHRFMGWNGPILTDSGGFQVFSLGAMRKITEKGVHFRSPINGDRLFLTPEESMRIQTALNARLTQQV